MKAMVLCSGGVDSTTCLGIAVDKYGAENVVALSIYYGQRHTKEIESADKVTEYYGVEHISLDLEKIFQYSDCSLLAHSDKEIPEESYAEQIKKTNGSPVSTYVPFRNGLFLSSAASIALSKGCEVIYYGAHSDDAAGSAYPDCSDEFNKAMNEAIYLGSGGRRWHRRHRHRRGRVSEESEPQREGGGRGARLLPRAEQGRGRSPQDPGHRRRLCPRRAGHQDL